MYDSEIYVKFVNSILDLPVKEAAATGSTGHHGHGIRELTFRTIKEKQKIFK